MDNKEEDEGSQINVSFCFSNSEIFYQNKICFSDYIGENNYIYVETYREDEVVKSEILNEIMDVVVENCHENYCQGYFEKQFDNLQRELLFEQPSHGKIMT